MMLYELDARRLLCPIPVIKTQNKIKELRQGDQLRITATDPGVLHDIPSWCKVHGHTLLSTDQIERDIIIIIEVN
jgi:tRNA 2-thiouridine synthesizing protein A